jgi:DDE family transposase
MRSRSQNSCHQRNVGRCFALRGITLHILVWEKSDRADAIFSCADLIWDKRHGHAICPNGKRLCTSGTVHDGRTLLYRASKRDCDVCPLRSRCYTRDEARKVPRDLHEEAPDCGSPADEDEGVRQVACFAHLKTHHGFERLRLRGGARDEFHLATYPPQNMK